MTHAAFGWDDMQLRAAGPRQPLQLVAPRPAAWDGDAAIDPLVPTIFHEPWWLQLVSRGACEEVEVRRHGQVVGRLPYWIARRRLLRTSVMPELTHALGPAVDEGSGSINTRTLRRLDIVKELIAQLPKLSLFSQVCHRGIADVLAFQACGFDTSVHFSSEIAPAPEAQLWAAMRDKTRNVIRRAEERERVEELHDAELFRHFYADNLAGRSCPSYFDLDLIAPLFEACRARSQGRMLMCRDDRGRPVAAVFYVWDRATLWYFLSTRDPAAGDNGAVSLLVWEAIREAARRGLVFDFDGVSSEGSARFFAGFGGRIAPRYAVRRATSGYELARRLKTWLLGSRRNFFTGP